MSIRDDSEALEGLLLTDGWSLIVAFVKERVASIETEVLSGTLDDARYQQATAERAVALGIIDYPRVAIDAANATEETT